ncbi:polysaccharide lyase family 8 super-sandwich domain-containing protein [Paenibacillus koleovorans]|uniref:polysaccharide lyase family 8 super-sandwich domain-containing protein n=1 Tax=Paenibacillus koleovorans TaxID=121608 RepID=UPI000FD9BEEE|nr:polysaccharide lyase family 8 super-sandwich domain-containing protein [Paenibacillus koleovorans]
MKKTLIGSLVLTMLIGLLSSLFIPAPKAQAADMDIIKQNIIDYYTYGGLNASDSYVAAARSYINGKASSNMALMNSSGGFTDYSYTAIPTSSIVTATNHYNRLLQMASAFRMQGGTYYMNATLKNKIELGFQYMQSWIYNGAPKVGGWFEWEYGMTRKMGPALVLMQGYISNSIMTHQISALNYALTDHLHGYDVEVQGAGTNDIWTTTAHTFYAALTGNTTRMQDIYDFICDRIVPDETLALKELYPPETHGQAYKYYEFIKPDYSYHAHANILYTGGYGDSFARDAVKLQMFLKNTAYSMTARSIATIVDYMLEGYNWMLNDRNIDMSASGRELSLKTFSASFGFYGTLALISLPGVPRYNELIAMAKRLFTEFSDSPLVFNDYDHFPGSVNTVLNSSVPEQVLTGHKHFQYSDFTVHRDADFYASVKMVSRRTKSGENTSNQGKKFYNVSDGVFYLMYDGNEYWKGNVRAAMNWDRLPGTTVEVFNRGINDSRFSEYGEKNFTGGAYGDTYGVSAFDHGAQGSVLEAKKSYFFFDDEIVFLGSNINTPSGNTTETIVTQWPLSASSVPLYVNGTNVSSSMGWSSTLSGTTWASSDNTGYYFPGGQTIKANRLTQSGAWSDLRDGQNSTPVTQDFLTLYYDHGANASNQSYSYAVVPNVTNAQMASYAGSSPYSVLAQTSTVHAVKDASTNAVGAVFWAASNVDIVTVNQPSIVYYRENGGNFELSLNNPEHTTKTITVTVNKVLSNAQLPAGVSMTPSGSNTILTFNTEKGNNYHAKFTVGAGSGAPSAPSGLAATAGNAQVSLTWNASSGATSYTVKRSTTSGSGYSNVQTGITGTSFVDTGRTNGTTYYYVVTATNSSGTSSNSSQASATPVAPPSAPTGLGATPGDAQVALSWSAVGGASGYTVKRSLTSGGPYATIASGLGSTSYTNTGLSNGTTYYYVVSATNAGGEGSNSSQVSGTPAGGTTTALNEIFDAMTTDTVPTGWTIVEPTSTDVRVKEVPSAGDKSMYIWDGNSTAVSGIASALKTFTSQSGTNVTAEWKYRGNSSTGDVIHFALRSGANNAVELHHNNGNLVWRDASGVDSTVQALTTNTWYTIKLVINTTTKSYDIYVDGVLQVTGADFRNTTPTSIDTFYVASGDTTVVQAYVDSVKVNVPSVSPPSQPTGLAAVAGNGQVALSWNAVSGATSYTLKRATTSGGPYTVAQSGITTTSYTDTGLTAGTTYYYVLSATNAGGEGANSAQVLATPLSPPAAPAGLVAVPGNTQVELSWNAVSDAISYKVKRSTTSGGPYTTVASDVTATTFTNNGLTNSTAYYYVVSAINEVGESVNSSQVSATPVSSGSTVVLSELFDGLTTGTTPSGWTTSEPSSTDVTVAESPSATDKSMFIWDGNSTASTGVVSATKTFTAQSGTNVNVEWKFKGNASSANNLTFAIRSSSTNAAELVVTNGNLVWRNSSGTDTVVQATALSTWYSVKLVMNTSAKTYDIYVDNVLKVSGAGFRNAAPTSVNTFHVASGDTSVVLAYVNDVKVTVPSAGSAPAAPTGLATVASSGQVALSWSASAGATSYTVKRSTTSGSGYSNVQTGITGTSYTNGTLTNGTTYYFVVTASNAGGESAASTEASGTPIAAPGAPTGVTAFGGAGQITLSWTPSSGAASYTVKRSTTSGSGYVDIQTGLTAAEYTDTSVTNGTTYYYVVSAVNAGGTSSNSSQASAMPSNLGVIWSETFDGMTTGAQPTGWTSTEDSSSDVQIEESKSATDKSIWIWDGNASGIATTKKAFTSQSGTNIVVEWQFKGHATADVAFQFAVRNNTTSAAELYLKNGGLYWRNSAGTDSLAATTVAGTWYDVKLVLNTSTKKYDIYFDEELVVSQAGFRNTGVTSVDTFYLASGTTPTGQFRVDNVKVSSPTGTAAPAAPTNLVASPGNAQIGLTWDAVTGATSYTVKRSTTSGSGYSNVQTGITATSFTNTSLTNGTTYYYVVSAFNGATESPNSAEVGATPAGIPTVVLNETFDSMTTDTVPTGYTINEPASTDVRVKGVPSATDKSMYIWDGNTTASTGTASATKSFTSQTGTNLTVEWQYRSNSDAASTLQFAVRSSSTSAAELYVSNGNLVWRNSSGTDATVQAVSTNTWYAVKLVINTTAKTYNIYVDGVLKISGAGFRNAAPTSIDTFHAASNDVSVGQYYIDDIVVTKP